MRLVRSLAVVGALIWVAAVGKTTRAATLYGVAYSGSNGLSTLYTIDPATGTAAAVGPIGFQRVSGIDFGPDGRLYGAGERNDGSNTSVVIVINTATGAGTEVGPTGLALPKVVTDISFRPSDGTLYAYQDASDDILTLNPATGAATLLGPPGPTGGGNGIAFNKGNVLFLIDGLGLVSGLYRVNQTTGGATLVAGVTFSGFPAADTRREVNAMDVEPATGVMFASVNAAGGGGGPNYLATVNTATAAVTHIGLTVSGLDAIAWQPDRCPVTLYGAAKTGGPGAASTLYRIDPNTGGATAIGPIGFNGVGGIDFHPVTKVLYGVGRRPADGADVLIKINPVTGAGSAVGPLVNAGGASPGGVFDLSFRSDGTLFLLALPTSGVFQIHLFTVSTASGLATDMGNTGTLDPGNGIGFSLGDTLYQANDTGGGTMYTVNQGTGASTAIKSLIYAGFPPLAGPRINAIDFDPSTGVPFVSVNDGAGGAGPNYLATLDTRTGRVSRIGSTINGLDGLAWVSNCEEGDPCTVDECVRCQDAALFGAVYTGPNGLATLYRINPASGVAAAVGPIGFERVSAMDFDDRSGLLYATAERAGGSNTNVLIVIDPSTGAGTEVGPTGIAALGPYSVEPDIAFRHSDGTLFAYLDLNDAVATINPFTGAATLVGVAGVPGFGNGIEFSPADVLFHADGGNVNTLNQTTGAATFVAPLSYAGFPPLASPAVNAMDANCSGVIYASVNTGPGGPDYLATINPLTGVVTNIGVTQTGLDAIAWVTTRGFCRHTFLDSDGDGKCDGLDCAPGDPGAFAVPTEVVGDMIMADKVTWFWPSVAPLAGSATKYDLVSDLLSNLPVGPGGGTESFICAYGPTSVFTGTPFTGTGFWFIVRGHNICGAGTYGNERHNLPVVTTPPRTTTTCP